VLVIVETVVVVMLEIMASAVVITQNNGFVKSVYSSSTLVTLGGAPRPVGELLQELLGRLVAHGLVGAYGIVDPLPG
jgi:hypothetical protein